MVCPTEEQLFLYSNDLLDEAEQRRLGDHIAGCSACDFQIQEFEKVARQFKDRSIPLPSKHLAKKCSEKIIALSTDREAKPLTLWERLRETLFIDRSLTQKTAIAFAGIVLFAVLINSTVKMWLIPGLASKSCPEEILTNRTKLKEHFQHHLVSVEAMLLDVSNGEDVSQFYTSSETRQLLDETRCLKEGFSSTEAQANVLLGEIEWFLEEILVASDEQNSEAIIILKDEVEGTRILNKIHQFIS